MARLRADGWDAVGLELDPLLPQTATHVPITTWREAKSYDVISYVDCFEHTFVWEELPLAMSHLNPGGRIIIEIPVAQEVPRHFRRLQHLFFFDEAHFAKMLQDSGAKIHSMITPVLGKRTAIIGR